MIKSFKNGLSIGLGQWRTALTGYLFQLLLALTLGVQVYHVLEASIGNSLEINKLITGYDDTVVNDFLNGHGASLSPLIGQLRWVLLVYMLFSVFINAGLLYAVVKNKKGWKIFWEGGAAYFFPFFKLAVFFMVIALIWTAALWLPLLSFLPNSTNVLPSEKTSVFLLCGVVVLYFTGLIFIFNWSAVSRIKTMEGNKKYWRAIGEGFKYVRKKFFPLAGLIFLFILMQLILIAIYWWAESIWGMVSPLLIFVFFVAQQIFVYIRWLIKISIYGGLKEYYFNK
ncbi:MAG TPA: hypothetical protein ENJ95_01905 [Bacteroidetes bacterium]|nr:hypothetical protein [Bacteroidota bacterium]